MTPEEYQTLKDIGKRNGYGFVQQIIMGLWSFSYECQGLPLYDVPTPIMSWSKRAKKEIDVARYTVEKLEAASKEGRNFW